MIWLCLALGCSLCISLCAVFHFKTSRDDLSFFASEQKKELVKLQDYLLYQKDKEALLVSKRLNKETFSDDEIQRREEQKKLAAAEEAIRNGLISKKNKHLVDVESRLV